MIYEVNSPLFRSFLSQKGGTSDKRCVNPPKAATTLFARVLNTKTTEEQKPKEQRPKASDNKPVMNE